MAFGYDQHSEAHMHVLWSVEPHIDTGKKMQTTHRTDPLCRIFRLLSVTVLIVLGLRWKLLSLPVSGTTSSEGTPPRDSSWLGTAGCSPNPRDTGQGSDRSESSHEPVEDLRSADRTADRDTSVQTEPNPTGQGLIGPSYLRGNAISSGSKNQSVGDTTDADMARLGSAGLGRSKKSSSGYYAIGICTTT